MAVHSPTWEKASARKARAEPSMVQAAQTTANQHAEYTDHNIQPRDVQILERSVRNHHKRLCWEPWHSTLDNAVVNERKTTPHTYLWFSKTAALVASTRTNLQIATMMKGDRSHRKFRTGKTDQISLNFKNVYYR